MKGKIFSLRQQRLRYVVSDLLMTNLAFFLFNLFRYSHLHNLGLITVSLNSFLSDHKITLEQIFIPLGIMAIYWISGFYTRPYHKSRIHELIQTLGSAFLATASVFIIFLTNDMSISVRNNLALPGVLFTYLLVLVYAGRLSITLFSVRNFRKANWSFTTLIIGNSIKARRVADRLSKSDIKFGYNVIGFVEIPGEHNAEGYEKDNVYGVEMIEEICRREKVMQFIICPEKYNDKTVLAILDKLFHIGIPIKIAPDVLSFVTASIHLDDIYGEPFVDLTSPRLADWKINVKRVFDITASLFSMIVLSPVYLALAIGIKMTSLGPIIYSQERIGRLQRPFMIYKFRSMEVDAESDGPRLSHDNDPRITGFGRFMRKYRLDELPQFFNVVKGDMSIVGPRPERMFYIKQIVEIAPYFSLVYQVRPGITSWGMIRYGYASSLGEMIKRTKYDLIYISNMSLTIDLKILIYTVKTIFKGSGK